jgi:hypothetical protein
MNTFNTVPEQFERHANAPRIPLIEIAREIAGRNNINPKRKFDKKLFGKFAWVPISKLVINFDEQRYPEDKHILKLFKKYDTELCTPLIAVHYPNTDTYHVSDGQQHAIATLLEHLDLSNNTDVNDIELPVWYVQGDVTTERKIVLGLNRDNLPMGKFFIHVAEVKNGTATAVKIQNMCNSVGVFPAFKAKGKLPCVTHITNLYLSYKKLGERNTAKALEVLTSAFPINTSGKGPQHINTLAMLGLAGAFKQMKANNTYSDALAEDMGLVMRIAFKDMKAVHKEIKAWFERMPKNLKLEVENIGRYSSGILKAYESVTGHLPVQPIFNQVKPIIMLESARRVYKDQGGLYA